MAGYSCAPDVIEMASAVIDNETTEQLQNKHNVLFMNIRSMRKNFDLLLAYINEFLCLLSIIVLAEVNIKEEEKNIYSILGFDMFVSLRDTKRGGGVIVYVKKGSDFIFSPMNSLTCEGLIGVGELNGFKTNIISIYRPPNCSNITNYIQDIDKILSNINVSEQVIYIGDINLDLNSKSNCVPTYENVMASHAMIRCIHGMTRVEPYGDIITESCIDHCYVRMNNVNNSLYSIILE